ncbi:hypothetical protein, partial [Staphylococcus aureus]
LAASVEIQFANHLALVATSRPLAARPTIAKSTTHVEKISPKSSVLSAATEMMLFVDDCKKFLRDKVMLKELFPLGVE